MTKRLLLFIPMLFILALFFGCEDDGMDHDKSSFPIVGFVGEQGDILHQTGTIKAGVLITDATVAIAYINGYERGAVITVRSQDNSITGSARTTLAVGGDEATVNIALDGTPLTPGLHSLIVSIKADGVAEELLATFKITVGDSKNSYVLDFAGATLESNSMIIDDHSTDRLLIPYSNGFGRDINVVVSSAIGISGEWSGTLNGDFLNSEAGDVGTLRIPISGMPTAEGEVTLAVNSISDGDIEVDGDVTVSVLGTLPTLGFEELALTGTLTKSEIVDGQILTLAYTNGYSREYTIEAVEVSGISVASHSVTLGNGATVGTLEIPLSGAPTTMGNITLVVTLTSEEGDAITRNITINVVAPTTLDFNEPTITGEIVAGSVVSEYTVKLNYKNGCGREVTPTITLDVASGLTATINGGSPLTLEDGEGFIDVSVTGDAPVTGVYGCSVSFAITAENEVQEDAVVEVFDISVIGSVAFDLDGATIVGVPLLNGIAITSATTLEIPYTNGSGRTVHSISVTGQATATMNNVQLAADAVANVISVPLTGTPNQYADLVISLVVNSGDNAKTKTIKMFAADKVDYEGLPYYTTFIDLNANGQIDPSEVWLDRNLGATSNDPGTRGNNLHNPKAVGNYYHFGKAYSAFAALLKHNSGYEYPEKDVDFSLPADKTWDICPSGYRMPTYIEYQMVSDQVLGTKYGTTDASKAISKYTSNPPNTIHLTTSGLKITLAGVHQANPMISGNQTAFWTSSLKNGTSPYRVIFGGNQSDIGDANVHLLRANVRCLQE